ncbi:Peptidyl-prolyl cis-trans isomerase FKBP5 (PPIase FKBP5) (51 kDa FK506-binding protein) (51 kDa FKBP) (FKBP-51) (FK506-binding protein 5) (FKBP-5) (Rotamase), partial [Durusdinium trenchii]
VNLHYASYLSNGSCVETSRCKNHETPCAFQLGGQQALPSWQLAAASMRPGEVCWICSPPSYAYGPQGVPRKVPGNETMWFCLELNFARAPGTVKFSNDLQEAMLEAEKHME